ncbi:putative psoralen synthase [Dioscorea sansibarensis]
MDDMLDYESVVIIVLLALVTLVLVLAFNFKLWSRGRKLPPGPWRIPVIGNLHQPGKLPHRSHCRLAEKHWPLMHLQQCQIPAIIVSSTEVASEIMKTRDLEFCSRPSNAVLMKLSYNGLDISISKYGEHWRQMRRLGTLEIFSMKSVESCRSVREEEVHVLIQCIRRSCSQGPVNLSEMFLCMTNNIICREVFGNRFSEDGQCNRSKLHDLVMDTVELMGGFSIGDFFHSSGWLNVITGFQGKLERNFKRMDEFFEREIEVHCSSLMNGQGHDDQQEDFLDVLLKSQKDSANLGFSLTRDHIRAILMLLLPQESTKGCQVFGYDISKSTSVLVNAWAIGRDPKFWENPEIFMQERFEGSAINYRSHHFEFIPFGADQRICPGMQLRTNWELSSGMWYKDINMIETFGIVLHKKLPLLLAARPTNILVKT